MKAYGKRSKNLPVNKDFYLDSVKHSESKAKRRVRRSFKKIERHHERLLLDNYWELEGLEGL